MNIVLVIIFVTILIFTIVHIILRRARQDEIKSRHDRFVELMDGTKNPPEALEWLSYRLLVGPSFDNHRHYKFTLDDLSITHEQLRETQVICLRLWWKQLNLRMPTIREACKGADYLKDQIEQLTQWLVITQVNKEDIVVDVESIKNGYMDRCCKVLEEGLYYYPDRAWHDWPAPILQNALLEYWINPEPERIKKWNDWVIAAKKRHAHRLLTRLREGRYIFPKSDDRVTRLLVYLNKAGSTLEDIGTDEDELEQLRGFMYQPKKKTNVVCTTHRGTNSN